MKLSLTLDYDLAEGFLGPYLSGLREGRAVAGVCVACHRVALPPEATCPCGARDFVTHTLAGTATVMWRTTGTDGDIALVRFDGADTLSVARLDGFGHQVRGVIAAQPDGALVIGPETEEGAA